MILSQGLAWNIAWYILFSFSLLFSSSVSHSVSQRATSLFFPAIIEHNSVLMRTGMVLTSRYWSHLHEACLGSVKVLQSDASLAMPVPGFLVVAIQLQHDLSQLLDSLRLGVRLLQETHAEVVVHCKHTNFTDLGFSLGLENPSHLICLSWYTAAPALHQCASCDLGLLRPSGGMPGSHGDHCRFPAMSKWKRLSQVANSYWYEWQKSVKHF